MSYRLRILSLGAGVQSSTLLLMAERGEIEPFSCAIFADTGWESQKTYQWLDYLRSMCKTPILTVKAAQDIYEHSMTAGFRRDHSLLDHQNFSICGLSLPVFTLDGKGNKAISKRQCTSNFKIDPIRKETRRLLGIQPRKWAPKGAVDQCVGISLDEAQRMKLSKERMTTLSYPLVDMGMTRGDCSDWLSKNGHPVPPKSSCIGCPFHDDLEWTAVKSNQEEWNQAVELDHRIRSTEGFRGKLFLHRSCVPLEEVDLSKAKEKRPKDIQLFLFKDYSKKNEFIEGLAINRDAI